MSSRFSSGISISLDYRDEAISSEEQFDFVVSFNLKLCISSSGIAREMEQGQLDSSTLELCVSSSGIAREMEQRPLDTL